MENLKELERRIKVALDRVSEGLEFGHNSQDANERETALQAEIETLSDQNANLSALLADLEKKRQAEAEELQRLYKKLAEVLNASDAELEERI
tara:strand:+ start:217 stop:495 length:279 start_codon:yes stop_codon:yes gene_type:complete